MRKILVVAWMLVIMGAIAYIFWNKDVQYRLPTPLPANYHPVSTGSLVNLNTLGLPASKPAFIHFFNPDCPCSRFNMQHFRSLVKQYGKDVNFCMVVLSDNSKYTARSIREKYDLDIPVFFDTAIAGKCGVYSTPQAVILDTAQNLFYRGNYNKSRYCTDPGTNYAQIALNTLLNHKATKPAVSNDAYVAYGCQLPGCNKQ